MNFSQMEMNASNTYCNWMERIAACEKQSVKTSWIDNLHLLFR